MTTTLHVDNVWTRVAGPASETHAAVRDLEGPLAGGFGLMHVDGNAFFSGLAYEIAERVGAAVVDARKAPAVEVRPSPAFLREYQRKAVEGVVARTRGIVKSPTGSGKTAIAAGIVAKVPIRWTVLVPKPGLVTQTAAWFRKNLDEPVGEVRRGVNKIQGRILVATYEDIHAVPEAAAFLQQSEGVIADECHRAAMKTAAAVLVHAKNAYYRIGLSATPLDRSDGRSVLNVALLGNVVEQIDTQTLVEEGAIMPLHFIWIPAEQSGIREDRAGNWNEFYREKIACHAGRNEAAAMMAVALPKPALVFARLKEHAQLLHTAVASRMDASKVAIVTGDVPPQERRAIVEKLRRGDIDVVVATSVFYEGVDIPELAGIVVATGYESAVEAVQRVGRGTRQAEGKSVCYVADFADAGHECLERHTLSRYQAYVDAGWKLRYPYKVKEPSTMDVRLLLKALLILHIVAAIVLTAIGRP